MNLRPFLPLLLGAFLLPASMESAHANPFSATSSSTNSLLEPRSNLPLRSDAYVVVNPKTGETLVEQVLDTTRNYQYRPTPDDNHAPGQM